MLCTVDFLSQAYGNSINYFFAVLGCLLSGLPSYKLLNLHQTFAAEHENICAPEHSECHRAMVDVDMLTDVLHGLTQQFTSLDNVLTADRVEALEDIRISQTTRKKT